MTPYNYTLRKIRAFTLMEVMVVIILLIIMAAFAIPNYSNAVNKARVRDAVAQLWLLHEANSLYYAQHDVFYPGADLTIDQINTGLNLNLMTNGVLYSYSSWGDQYEATAAYGSTFTISFSRMIPSIDRQCCSSGNCFSILADCPTR